MTIPVISSLPTTPTRQMEPDVFISTVDAFLAALPTFITQMNTSTAQMNTELGSASTNATAAASSASAAATSATTSASWAAASAVSANSAAGNAAAPKWVSGTVYAQGAVVWSPTDFQNYRKSSVGSFTSNTDPYNDATNWTQATVGPNPVVNTLGVGGTAWGKMTVSCGTSGIANGASAFTRVSNMSGAFLALHNQDSTASGTSIGLVFAHAGSPGIPSGIVSRKDASTWRTALDFYTNNITGGNVDDWVRKATLNWDGSFGLGVVPNAWYDPTNWRALQVNYAGIFSNLGNDFRMYSNSYLDSSGIERYLASSTATQFLQQGGVFYWRSAPSGTAGNAVSFVQTMSLDASGNLTTTGAGTSHQRFIANRGSDDSAQQAALGYDGITVTRTGVAVGSVQAFAFTFSGTTSNTPLTVNPTNVDLASGQLKFPASQLASSDANTLDDYEEGTWTPILAGSGGGAKTADTGNAGWYQKVGNTVTVGGTCAWNGGTGPTGNVVISGLPFTSNGSTARGGGSMGANSGLTYAAGATLEGIVDVGSAAILLAINATGGGGYSHNPTVGASGGLFGFCISYSV